MRLITALAGLTALTLAWPAEAQMGSHMLRGSSRMVERTITRNLDKIFRPRLVVREGATGPVTAMALSADERFLISAAGDNKIRVWDLNVGRELARLSGPDGTVTAVAVDPAGKVMAAASADLSLRLWDLKTLDSKSVQTGFAQPLSAVIFLSDGRVAAADQSGAITLDGVRTAGHSAGKVMLAPLNEGRFASAGADGKLRVWTAQGAAAGDMDLGAAATALASDGAVLAAGLADGRVLRIDPASLSASESPQSHSGAANAVGLGPGGAVYSGGTDGKVLMWNADGAAQLGRHDGAVSFVGAGKDGEFAVSGSHDGTSRLWGVAARKPLVTLLSTTGGWAVVDEKGRYDGNQTALNGIDWQGDDAAVGIESFAETHFEAALLPRILDNDDLPDAKSIPDGVRYPAKIRFVSPTASGDAANPAVQIEVEAADDGGSGIAEVRLYRNGRQVAAQAAEFRRETDENGAPKVIGRFELELGSGRNVLSATAVNEDRMESPPQNLVLNAAQVPARPPQLHLMTVGINAYANKDLSLFYALPDSRSVGGFFSKDGAPALPLGSMIVIEDGKATKENILAALEKLKSIPAQDMVVVYMAGHGVSLGDDWFYVPHEVRDADKDEVLRAGGVAAAELKRAMETLIADRTLLLLDTCHSGTAVSPLKDYRGMKSLRLMARSVGAHILAATDRDQYAIELARLGHGVFTYALLDGLKGKADKAPADGTVSAAEIIRYVEEQVPKLAEKYTDYAQFPTGYSRGMDFAVSLVKPKP